MGIGIGYSHLPGEHVWMCTGGGVSSRHSKKANITGPPSYHIWAQNTPPWKPQTILSSPTKMRNTKICGQTQRAFIIEFILPVKIKALNDWDYLAVALGMCAWKPRSIQCCVSESSTPYTAG